MEKMRNRFMVPSRLEGTAWSPKVMDLPPGRRFLVVSPHPDDDAIGCGGTIIKLIDSGAEVRVLYLSIQDGDFTRERRMEEIEAALSHLTVTNHRLLDMSFPSPKRTAEVINEELSTFKPDAVFMPSPFENHNQHLRVFESFGSASNGWHGDVIMFEVWGTLIPNLLVPVNGVMERKVAAVRQHHTQVKDIDYVRVVQGLNGYRAATSGLEGYAEAFMFIPSGDLIKMFH
jgi:LmbE family N-acetylglucosaminyl deacetylase